MYTKFTLAAIGLIFLTMVSCKKDNNGGGSGGGALQGQWNLVSMQAQTQSTQQYVESGIAFKTVTLSEYTTTNNAGTVTFSTDSAITKGLAYSVATTANGAIYENGQVINTTQVPFNFTLPPTNSSSKYQLIGKDSVYFPAGGLIVAVGSSGSQPTVGSGGRYVISGNTLTLTLHVNQSSTQSISGVAITQNDQGTVTTILSK
jgi:hypothetical protein